MALLRKLPHKTLNSQYILTVAARFFTTQSPNFNTFADGPTSAYYDDQVNDAGRSRDFDGLRHLLNKCVKDHCFNTTNTFKFITGTASGSLLDDLCQTLARPLQWLRPKERRVYEALRVVKMMARGNYGLSFHPILNVVTRKKRMEDAWGVVDLMRRLGAPPDLTAYNYLLMAYCFSGDLDSTAAVLKRIVEEGMRADTRTYDALVLGTCKAGKVEGALVLLSRMLDDRVPMQLSTHVYVINSLLSAGFYDLAVKFVRSFSGRDTWLDTENFGSLANRLIKLKRFDEAKLVLDEMKSRGLDMGDKLKEKYESI